MSEVKVDITYDSHRLDETLSGLLEIPRSASKKMIEQEKVLVNSKVITKASTKVREGDVITYTLLPKEESPLKAENIPLDIVYEDSDLLVINKPAGLVVHPGNGHHEGTLVNGLLYLGRELYEGEEEFRPGLVHRLDKDTSGLLVVAKNELAYEGLKAQLNDHSLHREYSALALGVISEDEAKIDAPLGRDPNSPTKFKVVPKGGKESITYFKVVERFSSHTLVKCRLYSGRTHQIRAHFEFIGYPIEGDPIYGRGNRKLYDKGQLLHAGKIIFKHPRTGEEKEFSVPLPDYFREVLEKLRKG